MGVWGQSGSFYDAFLCFMMNFYAIFCLLDGINLSYHSETLSGFERALIGFCYSLFVRNDLFDIYVEIVIVNNKI